jgi:hypothetical protein
MSKPTPMPSATAPTGSRNRMMIYGLAIVVLFGAMYPYTEYLNELKRKKELGEATIGQIDAGSFMLKLALLGGFRGVAANVLWTRAIDLQKMHEWDRLQQTVDMITKLQPHFLAVWTFQSWNLAYNVSVEWDDPADKYEWIKKGINFVRRGVENNQKSPDLLWDTAWYYYHKIGYADEAVILRKLFREDTDEDFKKNPLPALVNTDYQIDNNDNFEVSYAWFTKAVQFVDAGQEGIGGRRATETAPETGVSYVDKPVQHKGRPGDLNFRSMPAHARTRAAAAMEKASTKDYPPHFGQAARALWAKAGQEWLKFGLYPFPAFNESSQEIRIDLITRPDEFAKLLKNQQYWTERWSNDTNYRYWKDRCAAEGTAEGVQARRLFYEGTVAIKNARFKEAVDSFREGLEVWKIVLDQHKDYREDQLQQKDLAFLVRRYVLALRNEGVAEPPKTMPFYDLWQQTQRESMPPDPYDALEVLGRSAVKTTPGGN